LIEGIRKDYNKGVLSKKDLEKNPLTQFKAWMQFAVEKKVDEPNAMSLSTVNKSGFPSSRIVLLREISDTGLIFYTNYNSRKGKEIEENNKVCLLFFWSELQKQVRIEGNCIKTSKEKSDAYFYKRPIESQLASIASPQSSSIKNKAELLHYFDNEKTKFNINNKTVRPENWGGYEIAPNYFEFWQGGTHRLHDRFCYKLLSKSWETIRLAP